MAISPEDVSVQKRTFAARELKQKIAMIEAYFDQMLLLGHTDILLDQQFDESIQVDLTLMIKESRKLQDALKKMYRAAGWNLTFEADYKYVSFVQL